ncbi:hypothetical protein F4703DRAFT_1040931 [Phycomyces blakesleeanus]
MSNDHTGDSSGSSTPQNQPRLLPPRRNVSLHRQEFEKSKRAMTLGWDKVRDNLQPAISEDTIAALPPSTSISSASTSITLPSSTSRSPLVNQRIGQRGPIFNPFSRGQTTSDPIMNLQNDHRQYNMASTTLAAAQAAGMTNFGRNFRTSRFMHNNGIYATTTAVQQDIYRLERALDKMLMQFNTRGQHASFTNSSSEPLDSNISVPSEPTSHKLHLFPRHPRVETSAQTSSTGDLADKLSKESRSDITRVSAIMTSLVEILRKHKQATRLPLTGEILAILAVPFDQFLFNSDKLDDCRQALDIFDYIRGRFTQLTPDENFEQIIFCCRLMETNQLQLKIRIISTLKEIMSPLIGNTLLLPSTPGAFNSLVYTLVNALVSISPIPITGQEPLCFDEESDTARDNIIEMLDILASGDMIPIAGDQWDSYYTASLTSTAPVSIARFCVVESLCKSLMTGKYAYENPYKGNVSFHGTTSQENPRDKLIISNLLPRYWSEPTLDVLPAYLKVVFVLSEAATEIFLNGHKNDLCHHDSTLLLYLQFIQTKLPVSILEVNLRDKDKDYKQKNVALNLVTMLLSLLSVSSLEEAIINNSRFSPNHSPQPSVQSSTYDHGFSYPTDEHNSGLPVDTPHEINIPQNILSDIKTYFEEFWHGGYSESIVFGTEAMLEDSLSERSVRVYHNLAFNVDHNISNEIVKRTIPTIFTTITSTYPENIPSLSDLLSKIAKSYRPIFYKPVVSCVASNDQEKVVSLLTLMSCLRRYLSGVQYWMQDAEMINVLLLSDVGNKRTRRSEREYNPTQLLSAGNSDNASDTKWGSTTLGQCVVAAEFSEAIKELRDKQRDRDRNMEEDEIAKKFLIDLERRISVFMTAKEKLVLIPIPLRVIICNIFLDIRFFCNTTHRPGWLTRSIEWATQPVATAELYLDSEKMTSPWEAASSDGENGPRMPRTSVMLHNTFLDDVTLMFEKIRIVHALTVDELAKEAASTGSYNDRPVSRVPPRSESAESGHSTVSNDYGTSDEQPNPLIQRNRRLKSIITEYSINLETEISLSTHPPLRISYNESLQDGPATTLAKRRLERLPKINQDPFGSVFSLLVAVFTTLSTQEFSRLVTPLWERFTDDCNPQVFIPAAFLLMQCGEKVPKTVIEVTTRDFYSTNPTCRISAIRKHAAINAYRFNVLAQEYIPISSRRRPFRGDGGAFSTPFVPTDLGSNQYTMDEPRWMSKLKNASNFPIELKRQIQELGWDDDDQGEEHEALKKVLTPLALLPSLFLEEEDERMNESVEGGRVHKSDTKQVNISQMITRRKRASTVHAFTVSFLSMVDLLKDEDSGVASSLRELLETLTRDDPSLFLRAFLSDLGKYKADRHHDILSRLRYLVSIQAKLPPGFAYILFNYLSGMLKWLTRENKKDGLVLMALIHPILAELTLSTNGLSTRDLRKNKIEHLLASTGRFWFTTEQPVAMFPRGLTDMKSPFSVLDIPWDVFSVAMLRISHIQFLTNFLTRYPREVYAVKKTLQDYEPITLSEVDISWAGVETEDMYFPDAKLRKRLDTDVVFESVENAIHQSHEIEPDRRSSQQHDDISTLSALRARVWLRFIDVLLNGLNKNYNDRMELERILKGVNVIILEHKNDFGIIGQTLVLYTRVVTRFKRLFVSNRGYTTFTPSLFKVFCDVERFPHIRSAITFAWCRFYAVHEEAFVFQMLGALVPLILKAYIKSASLGSWMTDNLFTLMQAMHSPPRLGATSDVLGLQLQVELDDHERSIQERIDSVSNPMAIPLSTTILKPLGRSVTAPILPLIDNDFSERKFKLDNFIRLFLTVIAYDPGSLRAEQFVKMFRHLLPRFWRLTNLKELVAEGVSALVEVFVKFSKNAKPLAGLGTTNTSQSGGGTSKVPFAEEQNKGQGPSRSESAQHAYGKQWQQNDRLTIKKEFVLLVREYLKNGGKLSEMNHEKMATVIKIVMRDYGTIRDSTCSTDWIRDYLVDALNALNANDLTKNYTKPFKKILIQIHAQYRTQWKNTDAADLYEGLAIVLERGQGQPVNMMDIAGVIKERFVPFGITVAMRSEWEKDDIGHTRFCNSLVRLIIAILETTTQDVLYEIEQLPPSAVLIGKILIPICLQYDLRWDGNIASEIGRYRPNPSANWMRLLAYTTKSCSQASLLKAKTSGFSLTSLTSGIGHPGAQDTADAAETPETKETLHSISSVALLFSLSFVALKIILIRGAKSFDGIKGAWVQVAYFLKEALAFGQALKTLRPKSGSGRSTPSQVQSPGTSPNYWSVMPGSPDFRISLQSGPVSMSVVYDFAIWRFLEFVVCYKSPLILFLRDFIHERLRDVGSSHNRSTIHGPVTPRTTNSGMTTDSSGRRSRWKSWSGGLSPKEKDPIPTVNINTPSVHIEHDTSPVNLSPDTSTCGLGLHIPGMSRPISSLNSPSFSARASYDWSDTEQDTHAHPGLSPRSSTTPRSSPGSPGRPSILAQSSEYHSTSTLLHAIHAESLTALVAVQVFMGYKPALPWMTDRPDTQLRPWSYHEAVKKMVSEWQLMLQLRSETAESMNKQLPLSAHITGSPLQ